MNQKFSILILTIGIPGAGKTYWVKNYIKEHPLTHVISTDDLRKELTGVEQCVDPSQNEMIHETARNRVSKILHEKSDVDDPTPIEVIVDSTNCNALEWLQYKQLGPTLIRAIIFDRTPEEAMKNQEMRERKVPFSIVKWKWDQLQNSKKYLDKIFNMIDYM